MTQFFRLFGYSSIASIVALSLVQARIGAQQVTPQTQSKFIPQIAPRSIIADSRSISALAAHLKKVGAKMYGAYWCPHCSRQKEMFGAAFRDIDYVECDPRGKNPRPNLCKAAGIKGYPTWEVNGKPLVGVQSLEDLAEASQYKGSRQF